MELTLGQALLKGIEAHKAGQVQEADRHYTAILKAQPKHPDANHNMGVLAVGVGKFHEALPFFKAALEANPNTAQFWLTYIDTLVKLDRLADAKAVLDQAKSNGAEGDKFDKLDQQLDKVEPSKTTASQNQDPPENQLQSLINLYGQGQLHRALDKVSQLLTKFPNSVTLCNIQGASKAGLRQYDDAIDSYNKALTIEPDYADTHYNMGVVLQEQGKLEEAIEAYNKAMSIKPDYAKANYNIGVVLQDQGKLAEAIKAYNKAVAIKPDYADAHYNMGLVLQEQGKPEEAIGAYKKTMSIKPDYAKAHNNLGLALYDQGKLDEAIKAYNKALAIKPDYTGAWNNIGFLLQAMKTQISSEEELVSYYPKDTNSKYPQIARSILHYRLSRGGTREGSSLDEMLSLLSSAKNITIPNPTFNRKSFQPAPVLTRRTTALVNFGRSGTGLLHSLIDGHPEVSTLPSIYFSEYFDHSTWEKIISGGWNDMANHFMAIYDVLFDASSAVPIETKSKQLLHNIGQKEGMTSVGNQRDEVLSVDKTLFQSELKRLMNCYDELDVFVFFRLVNAAYDKAINDLNHKSLVFYHIHNPGTYAQLNFIRSDPNAKWVMMVREPIQSCESWSRSFFLDNNYIYVSENILKMLFEIDNIIYRNQNSIGIRLEDLKERPRQTIPALCKWMGIEATASLYEMTAQGKKWWGDPSSPDYAKDGMDPFGKTAINRKVGLIFSENDQFILRTLFYPFSVRFGYVEENTNQHEVDLQTVRPMLDQMFDFEKTIVEQTQANPEQFMRSGSYLYLRAGLIERWNTLNKFGTYPNMITPLKLD